MNEAPLTFAIALTILVILFALGAALAVQMEKNRARMLSLYDSESHLLLDTVMWPSPDDGRWVLYPEKTDIEERVQLNDGEQMFNVKFCQIRSGQTYVHAYELPEPHRSEVEKYTGRVLTLARDRYRRSRIEAMYSRPSRGAQ